jgi:phosphoribosylaminoimidazolecarboxamide formyltransferase/IMP cyclohydrolase
LYVEEGVFVLKSLELRYGMNPHQAPAMVRCKEGELPFEILNGSPGFINLLDALNAWQLVKELKTATGLPAAASFKHVSPAGAAVAVPLTPELEKSYFVEGIELSDVAVAYVRARGADRVSSYGDLVAVSDTVDASLARYLKLEVSDGIIAPGYDDDALEILRQKKKGRYLVLKMDLDYAAPETETREVFGIVLEQRRNDCVVSEKLFENIVTENKDMPEAAKRDLLVATLTLKYTQSNSVCFAYDGQVIGNGAGQQSRIHCVRLAASKADMWFLRQHPSVVDLPFREGLSRPEINNAVDGFLSDDLTDVEQRYLQELFTSMPARPGREQKREWLSSVSGVSMSSDAYFPFRDSIDRAAQSGVKYIVEPGGSIRDDAVIEAANAYGMVMAFSGLRLFHH